MNLILNSIKFIDKIMCKDACTQNQFIAWFRIMNDIYTFLSFWSSSFFILLPFCFVCLFCIVVFFVSLPFVFLSWNLSDQMSEGSEVSNVTLCVKILKWQWVSQWVSEWLTKVRYRAARAAKTRQGTYLTESPIVTENMGEGCNQWGLWHRIVMKIDSEDGIQGTGAASPESPIVERNKGGSCH